MYGADTYNGGDSNNNNNDNNNNNNNNNNNSNNNRETTFQIKSTKLYVPIVTLSTKDKVNLTKQLIEGFKRSVYWNEYKSKINTERADDNNSPRF